MSSRRLILNSKKSFSKKLPYKVLENCHFATLERDDYKRMLKGYYDRLQHEKILFLRRVNIFNGWSDAALSRLASLFQHRKFKMGENVFDCGNPITEIYIVCSGEFSVERSIKEDTKLNSSKNNVENSNATSGEFTNTTFSSNQYTNESSKLHKIKTPSSQKPKTLITGKLAAPQLFGFEEYVRGVQRHSE